MLFVECSRRTLTQTGNCAEDIHSKKSGNIFMWDKCTDKRTKTEYIVCICYKNKQCKKIKFKVLHNHVISKF